MVGRYAFIAVYILANRKNGTLYIGVTSNLRTRMQAHKLGTGADFPAKYGCDRLVYYERFENMGEAIGREKRLKAWKRQWKIELIESINPDWKDLSGDLPDEW